MKHYTSSIPLDLAEKLKDKGMPIILGKRYANISELQEHISASTMVFEVKEEKSDGKKIIDEILENKSSTDRGVKTEKTEG